VFTGVPDFRADLLATAVEADCVWSERRWSGTSADGGRMDMAGVILFGVRAERIAWARLYVEPVEQKGEGIVAAVHDISGRR
jgi:ketosteroid isomerase-like protein